MATRVLERKRGSRNFAITDGEMPVREFTETWLVESDTGLDDEGAVYNTHGLPRLGQDWRGFGGSTNLGTRVRKVSINDHESTKKLWHVDVEYSSEIDNDGSGTRNGEEQDPSQWAPTIEWSTELEEREVLEDASDPPKPVVNVIGDRYPNQPTDLYPIPVLRFSRWYPTFDASVITNYVNHLNSDSFVGFPAKTALMSEINSSSRWIYGEQFWNVTFVIRFNTAKDGWVKKVFEEGRQFIHTGGAKRSCAEVFGFPIVNLTEAGARKEDGPPIVTKWNIKRLAPFNPLVFG